MTPHQALALGVRLFVLWCALFIVRDLAALGTYWRPRDEGSVMALMIGGYLLAAVVLLILWFFPKSIARGLLPRATGAPTQALSYQMWFTLGTALIGLWFAASAITSILQNLLVLFILRPEVMNAEDLRSLRVGMLYYAAEFVLGLCLLFGATGIRKLVWRIRNAGAERVLPRRG